MNCSDDSERRGGLFFEGGDVTLNSGYISADLRDCRLESLLMASGDVNLCAFDDALLFPQTLQERSDWR